MISLPTSRNLYVGFSHSIPAVIHPEYRLPKCLALFHGLTSAIVLSLHATLDLNTSCL